MNPPFNIVVIWLLFQTISYCFGNVLYRSARDTSTPTTPAYNVTMSPQHYATTSNTPIPYEFEDLSEFGENHQLLDFVLFKNESRNTTSGLKCGEYAEEVATLPGIYLFLNGHYASIIINHCRNLKLGFDSGAVGGTRAYLGEFPHMVALGKYDSDGIFLPICGGTLISHTWVLTAAHCTHAPNGAPTHARMGIDRLTDQYSGTIKRIKSMVRHPDYNPPALYADIALMELATFVMFSMLIYPACLYQLPDLPSFSTYATVIGWGATEIDGEQSDYLQKVSLPLTDNLKCIVQHNTSKEIPHGITSNMICAGGETDKDACNGDSGGPLEIQGSLCMHNIIGITSFGRSCGITNTSGVYTRVSHYVPWIENIVWPQ